MTNHVHLIIKSKGSNRLHDIVRDLKKFTSVEIVKAIMDNPKESRKKWMLDIFKKAGLKNSNNKKFQFWRQDNHPIEIWSNHVIDQKVDYIHDNPVKAGFVSKAEDYLYSSAASFAGERGLVEIDAL